MDDDGQAQGPGTMNEMQKREFAANEVKEQERLAKSSQEHENKMMGMLAAFDKGVMNKEELDERFKAYDDKIALLEMKLLKAKAQGQANITAAGKPDEKEELRKMYPGLAERGFI
jgi:hypothetical protein